MRIAINGTGVAGPALAWWLRHYGHEPVLFEKAPHLRTGGYVIDFWGVGYDVAEKMGLLPALRDRGYFIQTLRMVDGDGRRVASLDVDLMRSLIHDRFISIARSELAATLFHACDGVPTRFGTSVTALTEHAAGVSATLSNGAVEEFDLVVGADGLHSAVRTLAWGPQARFETPLGYYVAAFTLAGYPRRDELTYINHASPGRSVSRVSLRDDRTLFLFVSRADLVDASPEGEEAQKRCLHQAFGDMRWETGDILALLDQTKDFYFDRVSQIHVDRWSRGRVALLGDAAACPSLLAGEGSGLAMAAAYVLAGELHACGGDFARAFERYEAQLRPYVEKKQRAALGFAGFFAPKSSWGLALRNAALNACSWPLVGRYLIGRMLRDEFELPD